MATLAVLTLAEYVSGMDLGIDQILISDPGPAPFPGRMAPALALNFLLAGLALGDRRSWSNVIVWVFAIPELLISFVSLVGFAYGVTSVYGIYISMASMPP